MKRSGNGRVLSTRTTGCRLILGEVKGAVASWRETTFEPAIGRSAQESMEVAFRS